MLIENLLEILTVCRLYVMDFLFQDICEMCVNWRNHKNKKFSFNSEKFFMGAIKFE